MDNNDIATSEEILEGEVLAGYTCDLTEVAQKRVKPGPKGGTWATATYEGILVGRNKVVIVPEKVYALAQLGLKNYEIANYYGVTEDAISRHFAAELQKGREEMKISLRRAMLNNAISNNNAAVQIFLAKNMLGMSDMPANSEDSVPLPWNENTSDNAE
jgi:hypothetical protein